MLKAFFGPAGAATTLAADDFPHLLRDISIASQVLGGALRTRTRGINVLLHGVPGTGKTALSRVLAKLAGATLYEVSVTEEGGNAATESSRLAAYAVAQAALRAAASALILFDDGAIPNRNLAWFGAGRDERESKGWLCRMLEENAVPAVWVANRIDHLDLAYLRRFALVLEVSPPPPAVRRTVVATTQQALDPTWTPGNLNPVAWYVAFSDHVVLNPDGVSVDTWPDIQNGHDALSFDNGKPQFSSHFAPPARCARERDRLALLPLSASCQQWTARTSRPCPSLLWVQIGS